MATKRILWLFLFCALILTSCSANSAGPSAWIDQPLDGSVFSLQPVVVTVHASDNDGVASFEVFLEDELLQTLSAGGGRLVEASWEWLPAGPGEYTLRVEALDSQGNRGQKAEAVVIISGVNTDLAQAPFQEIIQASIDNIECLTGQTVAVTFSISSPLGIESFRIWNIVLDVEHTETFQDPLPTHLSKTVNITEPIRDEIDRAHQWGLEVNFPGQTAPTFVYAMEPNDRCPDHLKLALSEEEPPIIDLGKVEAKQNTACRQGPDGLFEVSGYLLEGESATALGRLENQSWIQVEMPETLYICWIAANQLEYNPTLVDTLPAVIPPPLPVTIVTDTPEPDLTPPGISGLSTDPSLILTQSGGCSSYSRTTTVRATVTDNVTVSLVNASWSVGGESGQVFLSLVGGNIYEGLIGPVNTVGTLNINVSASDGSDNSNSASAPGVTVQNCIE